MELRGEATKPLDPVASMKRHWKKIFLTGIVTFVLLIPVIKIKNKIHYEAEGKIRIEPVITSILVGAKDSIVNQYGNYVGTIIFGIHNREVVEDALERVPEDLRKIFLPVKLSREKALDILMKSIEVEQIRETHLVRIFMLGEKPDGLAEMVNAIITVFLEKRNREAKQKNSRQLDYLKREEERITARVTNLAKKLYDLTGKAGMSTFSEQFNPLNRSLGDLQEAFTRAYGRMVETSNVLDSVNEEIDKLKEIPLDAQIDEMLERDQSLWNTSTKTYNDLQILRAGLDGLSSGNPELNIIEAQMERRKRELESLRKVVRARVMKVVYAKRDAELKKRLIKAESDYKAATETATEMRRESDRTHLKASRVSQLILKGQEIDRELKLLYESHVGISERIRNLQADSLAPGRVFSESSARAPYEPAGNNLNKLLALASLFSFGWITVLCFGFDLLDDRIRSPKDMEIALGFPSTWPVSHLQEGDFVRVTQDDPDSTIAKSIRSLAVRLDNERVKHNSKLALFTGVNSQSGVSDLVLNTAHAMRGLCQKVLVLELNLAAPKFARILGIPESVSGLKGLLHNEPLQRCMFRYSDRHINILPAIEIQQVQNTKISAVLDTLGENFDFILIDTVPILKSDLTEFVVGKADVGVLVVHGDRSLYRDVRHAAEILDRLELPALATVLNWKRRSLKLGKDNRVFFSPQRRKERKDKMEKKSIQ